MTTPTNPTDQADTIDELVSEILGELTERVRQGQEIDIAPYIEAHPECEERLRQLLPTIEVLANLDPESDPSSPTMQEPEHAAGKMLGDYRIVDEIGRGGMGIVYEAEQVSIGRRVALKVLPFASVLDDRQIKRFKNEVRAAGTLDHPNIVPVHTVGEWRGVHYYAMTLIRGQSLAEVIAELRETAKDVTVKKQQEASSNLRPEQVPPQGTPKDAHPSHEQQTVLYSPGDENHVASDSVDVIGEETDRIACAALSTDATQRNTLSYFHNLARLGVQVAEALQHAHENGVLHRDIKPANLMLDRTGKLWVTDFGLARLEADAAMTMTGDLMGTLRYMSPEQAMTKRIVIDHRTDIYSLGVTLYELLTLQHAYVGENRQELLRQIAFDDPLRPRRINTAIPAEFETIVLKAMAKNPAERYKSAAELADDLNRFLEDRPIHARPPSLVQRGIKWSRRHKVIVTSAVVMLVLTMIGVAASNVLIAAQRNNAVAAGKRANRKRNEAQQQRDKARREREKSQQNLYLAEMRQVQHDWSDGPMSRLQSTLLRHVPAADRPDLRQWEWYFFLS